MDLFIYTDESGVFDKVHNSDYVYGGLILFGKNQKEECARKYLHAERCIRYNHYSKDDELKASFVTNREKGKLLRSLNAYVKFGVIINQCKVLDSIFSDKKTKQRYLDYAYKIGLKRCLENLISTSVISPDSINNMYIFADEHSTATDGRYELKETLEQEFKRGTYNFNWDRFFPPIFPRMGGIVLHFCNSECTPLVRAADIVANKIYNCAISGNLSDIQQKIHIVRLP
ncbi:DUF3800 domain-containing protein [Blautia producta]|uniref:DUF3800 domain-containing protein n=1 Tax=Blautia producta TaxID=33035 RepID=UPI0031B587D5